MGTTSQQGTALTAADFQSEVGHADVRRREPRFPCERLVELHLKNADGESAVTAKLVDCSTRGLGLIVPHAMEWGERFTVNLDLQKPRVLTYEARYSREIAENEFRVGAEFIGFATAFDPYDSQQILRALLSSFESSQ
jgi:hypothetical protein